MDTLTRGSGSMEIRDADEKFIEKIWAVDFPWIGMAAEPKRRHDDSRCWHHRGHAPPTL